jgi:hypothetical protein
LQRQLKKGALCSVLDCLNPPSSTNNSKEEEGEGERERKGEHSAMASWDQLLPDVREEQEQEQGRGEEREEEQEQERGGEEEGAKVLGRLEQLIAPPAGPGLLAAGQQQQQGGGEARPDHDPVLQQLRGLAGQVGNQPMRYFISFILDTFYCKC